MKNTVVFFLLALVSPLCAAPIDDAVALLQSRKFPEAASAFGALPPDAAAPGYAAYLKALSLHLAGQQDEAIAAADTVPPDSPWGLKARFLTGSALTKQKKHPQAEAIYAEAAARAFAPQRRDELVKELLDFAAETITPAPIGEVAAPKPDWKKSAALCEKVLDMPITDGLRAEVLFRLAMLFHKADAHQAAQGAFNAWLLAFDPNWSLPLAPGKTNTAAKLTGKPRAEARLHLAENLLELRRTRDARAVADELLAMLAALPADSPDKALAGDAAWLQVRTFARLPQVAVSQQQLRNNAPNQAPQIQQAAQGMTDPFAPPAAQGGTDPFAPPSPQHEAGDTPRGRALQLLANQIPFPSRGQNPAFDMADYLAQLRAFLTNHPAHPAAPSAAGAIAQTLDFYGKDAEAISAWNDFIAAKAFQFDASTEANKKPDPASGLTPTEALARRQQAAAFRIGQLHLSQRRYAEAIAQWRQYITAWPNGAEWQQAQSGIVDAEFQIGLTAVAAGDEPKAREVFDAFLSRYPLDSRARQILFIYGQTRYAAAQQLKEQQAAADLMHSEFQKAIDAWARLIAKYPAAEEASLALYNTALILSDEFGQLDDGLAAFRRVTWGHWADPAKRRVNLLNSKSLAVATERVFRLTETPAVKVSVRNIEKLKVSRYPLDVEAFFRSRHRMDAIDLLDIDLIAPEKSWEVPVTNYARFRSIQQDIPIEFAAGKSGACIVRVEGDDWQATTLVVRSDIDVLVESARRELLAYVMNGADKKPLVGANVLVSDGEKIIATGLTGADGVFRAKPEGIEKSRSVRVLVSTPQGMAGSFLSLEGLGLSTVPTKMSRVLFDRGCYAAGEQVGWHAIRRDVKDGTFQVPAASEGWKWRAQLPDGRLLYEGPVAWDALGLCHGEFTLPPSAVDGDYKVRVFNDKESLQASFSVEEADTSPRGRIVSTQPARQAYLRGDVIKGTFLVNWSNGLPVTGEKGILTLPDGTTKDILTDAAGALAYEFPATALKPGAYFLTLNVPAVDAGHTLALNIVENAFSAQFDKLPEVALAGEAFDLKVKTLSYRGENFATPLKLTIVRREPAKASRVLEGVPWINGLTNSPADTPLAEHALHTAASGEANQSVTLPQAGTYVLKLSGKDKQGHDITAESTLRAAGGEDDSKLRLLSDATDLVAGQPFKLRVQSASAHPFALVTVHAQEFFSHQLVALKAGSNPLEIPTAAAYTPNFRVTVAALDGRQVNLTSRPFELRSGLKVTLTTPGAGAADYSKNTTDLAGKPVAATVFSRHWILTDREPYKPLGRVVIPARSTGLSVESSITFAHPGTSRKLTNGTFAVFDNDQALLSGIQQTELGLNGGNTLLLDKNQKFMRSNSFLLVNNASKRGVFVINPGLKTMKQDALGVDVRIDTRGIPDIAWNEDRSERERKAGVAGAHPSANVPEAGRAALNLTNDFASDPTGGRMFGGLTPSEGALAVVSWAVAVDGTSLIAADALVIPSDVKLLVHALLPDCVTPGQTFSIPVSVANRGATPTADLTAECTINDTPIKLQLGVLAPGGHSVRWLEGLKAPPQPGTSQVRVAVGGVTWSANLTTRNLSVPVIVPSGGLFTQGEHTLTLPVAEGVTGFRLVKAVDVAAFPGAALNINGVMIDASEPQNAASALLQILAALTNAQDAASKAVLQTRLATLTAELAATEHEGNGGWSWENIEISSGLLTTAFTWRALLEAKAAGVVVSDMMMKRTAAFVAGRYAGIGATDFERKAVVLQALAAAGKADFSLLNPLYRVRETLTPVALVRLCAAFIYAGRDDEAKALLALVLKTGSAGKTAGGDDTLSWPGSKDVAGLNAPEEATAAALWCAAKLNPAAPQARAIANWLVTSQASAPGGTTRCRGQVMQALAEYAKSLPRAAAGDTVEVLSDGKVITAGPGDILPLPADGKLIVRVKGAAPAVLIAAVVRETPPDDPKTWEYPKIASRTYLHDSYMLGETKLDSASTSPVTQAAYGQLLRVVVKIANHPDPTWKSHGNFLQIEEEIPAGCLFVEGSLQSDAQGVERHGNRLRLRYGPGTIGNVSYDVIALTPGTWTARAAVLADPYDPARCRRGISNTLSILPPGQPATEAYVMNRAEHLEAARLLFDEHKGAECLAHLDALLGGKLTQDEERDTARMRLWILTEQDNPDASAMIGAFELLTERHPRLVIPFEKLLRVGAAYRRLNEFERAATVFRAALDGAFLADSGLGVALEDAGDYAGGVDLQERLWQQYPDSQDVIGSLSGLAQSLSTKAPDADKLPLRRGHKKLEKNALLIHSRDLLERFITLYPTDPQTDDAAFSLVNVFFTLKDYPGMVRAATAGAERHNSGPFADSFKYMAALGYFWQGTFDKALAAAAPVTHSESKDQDYARYVTAQVYHAQGQPAEAITWYQKVKTVYEDAAQAIALFEEKRVSLPEVTIFKPGDEVKLTLDYRNIKEGAVQLYKVDLLKLYLREKSLSNITRVDLAGIAPQAGEAFTLGEGSDYVVKQKLLHLPVKEEGAYLAIVRGDNLFTSGLVLISPLKLEVKENPEGSVRATVTDAASGKALADAEVKALGSSSPEVQSGATDPRGVFEVGGIHGTSTVIVRQGDNRYAFHRGTLTLGTRNLLIPAQGLGNGPATKPSTAAKASDAPKRQVLEKGEYLKNIDESNKAVQKSQIQNWESKRRSNSKGVEASDVMKK